MSAKLLPCREDQERLSWCKGFSPHSRDSNSHIKSGGLVVTCLQSPNPWKFAGFPQLIQDHQGTGASRSSNTASCQDLHPGLRLLLLPQLSRGSLWTTASWRGKLSTLILMVYQLHQQTALILMLTHLNQSHCAFTLHLPDGVR